MVIIKETVIEMTKHLPKILIVDDNLAVRLTLLKGLTVANYEVFQANDGQQGCEMFYRHHPDIVLMDVQMPILNGFESVKLIRENESGRATPILMLTADDDVDSIRLAFEAGATDYITKPINIPLLLLRLKFALRDVEREKILTRAEQQRENARQLFGLVYWEINAKTETIVVLNSDPKTLPWLDPAPVTLLQFADFVESRDRNRFLEDIRSAVDNDRPFDLTLTCLANDGTHYIRIVGQKDEEGQLITGAIQDITQQKYLEDRTSYLNYYDEVTGLPNQKLFQSSVEKAREQSNELGLITAILVVEIQNLNSITNAYGSKIAETLQSRVAAELKELIHENSLVAKVDGGYYAVHLKYAKTQSLDSLVIDLHASFSDIRKSWYLNGKEIFVKYLAGIADNSKDASLSTSTLLRMAKSAQVKTKNGKDFVIAKYDNEVSEALTKRLNLEAELNRAFKNNEFRLQYQPQLCIHTNKIVGAEALLRWPSKNRGLTSPEEFIPILEESGLIIQLSEKIILDACEQQLKWLKDGLDLTVGINLSAIHFQIPDLANRICELTKTQGVDNKKIELEVTESATMDDPQRTINTLRKLRDAGFRIALDDFGTGYSSFEYLLNFELDKIKIDQAFIKNITDNRKDRALVKAMCSLGVNLNIKTIAEGIENRRQRDYLNAIGVDQLQGFYISEPLWPDDFYQFAVEFNQNDDYTFYRKQDEN